MSSSHFPPPQDLSSLLARLQSDFGALSPQFQGGARYLIDHPQEVPVQSMRTIAADAGVQPATLVRLAQYIGFDGWKDLRELFVEALRAGPQQGYARQARKVLRGGRGQMLEELVQAQHQNLDAVPGANAQALPAAADLLAAAANVYVAGFRACFPIAFTLQYTYRLFRSSVHLLRGDAGTLEMELRGLTAKDAVLVASFAPYSQESLRVAAAAREAGCKLVALTDSKVAPIALEADCTLLFPVDSPSFFPSIAAGIATAEALVEQLLARKGKGAIRALEAAENALRRSGAYVPGA